MVAVVQVLGKDDVEKSLTISDSLLIVLAYQQRRFYVFSRIDPFLNSSKNNDENNENDMMMMADNNHDVRNEAPTAQEKLLGSEGNHRMKGGDNDNNDDGIESKIYTKAILRTTMGDIHANIRIYQKQLKFFLSLMQGRDITIMYYSIVSYKDL